jgi:hypothetical protein
VSFDEVYVDTRRQLRGVAESLIAGRPEHFDVAATEGEVNYGVSAGDDYHPTPYAYVGPWTRRTGPFWNAPFGALYPLDPAHDVDTLTSCIADFFDRGRRELA